LRAKSLRDRAINALEVNLTLATTIRKALSVVLVRTSNNACGVEPNSESSVSIFNGRENCDIPLLHLGNIEGDAADYVTIFTIAIGHISVILDVGGDYTLGGIQEGDVGRVGSGDRNDERVMRVGDNSPVHGSLRVQNQTGIVGNVGDIDHTSNASAVGTTNDTGEPERGFSSGCGMDSENPGARSRRDKSEVAIGVLSIIGRRGRNTSEASPHLGGLSGYLFSTANDAQLEVAHIVGGNKGPVLGLALGEAVRERYVPARDSIRGRARVAIPIASLSTVISHQLHVYGRIRSLLNISARKVDAQLVLHKTEGNGRGHGRSSGVEVEDTIVFVILSVVGKTIRR